MNTDIEFTAGEKTMQLGLGLYRHMLTADNFRFAKQAGASHIVAHLTDYFSREPRIPTSTSVGDGWGGSDNRDRIWTYDELRDLRTAINAEGLELAAIENFDPSHWHDILLDVPRKSEQLDNLKRLVRDAGQAGIPCVGYNFSIAGVWGRAGTVRARRRGVRRVPWRRRSR